MKLISSGCGRQFQRILELDDIPAAINPSTNSYIASMPTTMQHDLDIVGSDVSVDAEAPEEDLINDFQRLQITCTFGEMALDYPEEGGWDTSFLIGRYCY